MSGVGAVTVIASETAATFKLTGRLAVRYKNLLFGCADGASLFVTIFPSGHPERV
jgi:hypothetical protein